MKSLKPGDVVIPVPIQKGNATFRIVQVRRGGWVVCESLSSDCVWWGHFSFRSTELTQIGT